MAPGARLRRGESHRRAGRSCCSDGGQWPSEKVTGGRDRGIGSGIGEEEAVGPAQPSCKLYFVTNSDNRPKSNLDSSPKRFLLAKHSTLLFLLRFHLFPHSVSSSSSPSFPQPSAAKPCHESPTLQPGGANEVTARLGHGWQPVLLLPHHLQVRAPLTTSLACSSPPSRSGGDFVSFGGLIWPFPVDFSAARRESLCRSSTRSRLSDPGRPRSGSKVRFAQQSPLTPLISYVGIFAVAR